MGICSLCRYKWPLLATENTEATLHAMMLIRAERVRPPQPKAAQRSHPVVSDTHSSKHSALTWSLPPPDACSPVNVKADYEVTLPCQFPGIHLRPLTVPIPLQSGWQIIDSFKISSLLLWENKSRRSLTAKSVLTAIEAKLSFMLTKCIEFDPRVVRKPVDL